jgi:hypothetical protein
MKWLTAWKFEWEQHVYDLVCKYVTWLWWVNDVSTNCLWICYMSTCEAHFNKLIVNKLFEHVCDVIVTWWLVSEVICLLYCLKESSCCYHVCLWYCYMMMWWVNVVTCCLKYFVMNMFVKLLHDVKVWVGTVCLWICLWICYMVVWGVNEVTYCLKVWVWEQYVYELVCKYVTWCGEWMMKWLTAVITAWKFEWEQYVYAFVCEFVTRCGEWLNGSIIRFTYRTNSKKVSVFLKHSLHLPWKGQI